VEGEGLAYPAYWLIRDDADEQPGHMKGISPSMLLDVDAPEDFQDSGVTLKFWGDSPEFSCRFLRVAEVEPARCGVEVMAIWGFYREHIRAIRRCLSQQSQTIKTNRWVIEPRAFLSSPWGEPCHNGAGQCNCMDLVRARLFHSVDSQPSAGRRGLRRWLGTFCLLVVSCSMAGAKEVSPPPSSLSELRQRLTSLVGEVRFGRALWGMEIVSLDTGRVLFAHNPDKLMEPASCAKLFTAALALDRLGADFRIVTSLYSRTPVSRNGTVEGDLILYGRGDPTFAAKFHDGDLDLALAPLVQMLTSAGVKRVQGDLVADQSFFHAGPYGAGWEWDDLPYPYASEVSALSVNDNAFDYLVKPGSQPGEPALIITRPSLVHLTVYNRVTTGTRAARREIDVYRPWNSGLMLVSGQLPLGDAGYNDSMAVPEPALWFGQLLRDQIRRRGIKFNGAVRAMDWRQRESVPLTPASLREAGSVESPPLREILARTLKPSQNLYAQLLLLQVGVTEASGSTNSPPPGSMRTPRPPVAAVAGTPQISDERAGLRALDAFLVRAGIGAGQVLLQEGSGLSRQDVVTPDAMVKLLRFMSQHAHAAAFRDALPIAGVDGTLKARMRGTAAAGNVRAKTGSLTYVSTLAGYVASAAGERIAFALLLNNYQNPDPAASSRADLDKIAVWLAELPWTSASQGD